MPTDPRVAVESAARALLRTLSALPELPPLRLAAAEGGVACLIQVWGAGRVMPTARRSGGRDDCRRDVVAALREAGRPLTRKELTKALRGGHGPGTVAKALADLTAAGELLNPRDRKGYRLAEWRRPDRTPSLFD